MSASAQPNIGPLHSFVLLKKSEYEMLVDSLTGAWHAHFELLVKLRSSGVLLSEPVNLKELLQDGAYKQIEVEQLVF